MEFDVSTIRKNIVDTIVKELGLQTSVDKIPVKINDSIQPVLLTNPPKTQDIVKSATGTTTIYTTPTDQDFYLCNAFITGYQTAGAGAGAVTIICTPEGQASGIVLALNLYDSVGGFGAYDSVSQSFSNPIKLARGSTIGLSTSISDSRGGISGYLVDRT